MMIKQRIKKLVMWLLLLAILPAMAVPVTAYADENANQTESCSLTVAYPADNITFSLFLVGRADGSGSFNLAEQFESYAVDLNQADSEGLGEAAQALAAYAARDSLNAAARVASKDGQVYFDSLDPGIYLLTWEPHTDEEGYRYEPQPSLILLPGQTEDQKPEFHVTATAKYDKTREPELIHRRVHKVWNDAGKEIKRPDSIQVQLLKNGEVYATVTLNRANGWSYDWNDLDGDASWQVVEAQVPSGYTVSQGRQGETFLLTNTPTPDTPPETPKYPPGLPRTGLLWWPVPVLLILGLAAFMLGGKLTGKEKKH